MAFIAEVEFVLPPIEKFESASGFGNLVAEVVGPAAISVDIVEVLVKLLRQQPGDNVEIFIMMRGEPARISLRFGSGAAVAGQVFRELEFAGSNHGCRQLTVYSRQAAERKNLSIEANVGHLEQGGVGAESGSDGVELRVMLAEWLGDGGLIAGEEMDEFEGVDYGFTKIVIVGDDVGFARAGRDFGDAVAPGSQLLRGVEVVVAFVLRKVGIVAEPSVIAAAVEANVGDRRGDERGRLERPADDRLIDVAESGVVLAEKIEEGGVAPGGVSDFDRERIVGKAREQ